MLFGVSAFPNVFENFYDDFNNNMGLIEVTNRFFRLIAFSSCILAFTTLIIVLKTSSRIKTEYRNILAVQLMLSCYGSLLVSIVGPYFLSPYPAILVTGLINIDHRVTLYLCFIIVITYFLPTMLLLCFGLIYNFISLKQLNTQLFNLSIDKFLKSSIFLFLGFMLSVSFLLFLSLYNNEQEMLQELVSKNVDFRVVTVFSNYAVFVFDVNSWPIRMASIQSIFMAFISIAFCTTLTVLSFQNFERQKQTVSVAASRNHRMMMYMLVSYVFHFLVYFSIPITLFTLSIYNCSLFVCRYMHLILMLPSHCLGISLSITYCLIITPYRNVIVSSFYLITCTHQNNGCYDSSRPSLQLSIIDTSYKRSTYRPNSSI